MANSGQNEQKIANSSIVSSITTNWLWVYLIEPIFLEATCYLTFRAKRQNRSNPMVLVAVSMMTLANTVYAQNGQLDYGFSEADLPELFQ